MHPSILRSAFLQLSAIIGVGIFGLPLLFARSNIIFSIFGLILLTALTLFVNKCYSEIILKTEGDHQFAGYLKHYLGKTGYYLGLFNILILSLGASLVFTTFGGKFLNIIFPSLTPQLSAICFLVLLLYLYLQNSKLSHLVFDFLPILFLAIPVLLLTLMFASPPSAEYQNIPFSINFFGWTLFSLAGFTILPEVEEILRHTNNRKHLLAASSIGLILAAGIYAIYVISVIRLSGAYLTWDSVTGLTYTHPLAAKIVAIMGILTITKGSLNFLTIISESLHRDLKLSKKLSNQLSPLLPVIGLFLLNSVLDGYIRLIATFSLGVSVALIFAMRLKIAKTTNFQKIPMSLTLFIFIAAVWVEVK